MLVTSITETVTSAFLCSSEVNTQLTWYVNAALSFTKQFSLTRAQTILVEDGCGLGCIKKRGSLTMFMFRADSTLLLAIARGPIL
jgi:hypothetical protein